MSVLAWVGVILGVLVVVGSAVAIVWLVTKVSDWWTGARQSRRRYRVLDAEVEQARNTMRAILQLREGPYQSPGIELAHRLRQATSISGDFYNLIRRRDDSLGIYLVDVEGHGLVASQIAQDIHRVLADSTLDWGAGSPREQLEIADRRIREQLGHRNVAVTMNFTEIDPNNKFVCHANAGMPFPLLFRHNQAEPEVLRAAGVYVGAGYAHYPVEPEQAEVPVQDGDLLVLYSDGIPEATDRRGRLFGQRGIIAAVSSFRYDLPERIADAILQAVSKHCGTEEPADDQTLVVARIGTSVDHRPAAKTLEQVFLDGGALEFRLRNAADTGRAAHQQLRPAIINWALRHGATDLAAHRLWVVTWEAIQNAVRYGSRRGDLIYLLLRPGGESLELEVSQPKAWPDWADVLGDRRSQQVRESVEPLIGGTVVLLRLASEIRVSNQGNRITMWFGRMRSRWIIRR